MYVHTQLCVSTHAGGQVQADEGVVVQRGQEVEEDAEREDYLKTITIKYYYYYSLLLLTITIIIKYYYEYDY